MSGEERSDKWERSGKEEIPQQLVSVIQRLLLGCQRLHSVGSSSKVDRQGVVCILQANT